MVSRGINVIKRIAIIGSPGSGKSTLAKQLQEIYNLPVYHLDQYFFKPNWVASNLDEYKVIHDKICDLDEWIIDGVNLKLMQYRIERADIIIFLDFPRYLCFYRIFKRLFKYYGKETPGGPQGCFEKLSWASVPFLKYVWNFKNRYPSKIKELLKNYQSTKKTYMLRSQKEIDDFIKSVT